MNCAVVGGGMAGVGGSGGKRRLGDDGEERIEAGEREGAGDEFLGIAQHEACAGGAEDFCGFDEHANTRGGEQPHLGEIEDGLARGGGDGRDQGRAHGVAAGEIEVALHGDVMGGVGGVEFETSHESWVVTGEDELGGGVR